MGTFKKLKITADTGANRTILKQLRGEGLIEFAYINLENAKLNVANSVRGWNGNNYPAFFTLNVSTLDGMDVLATPDIIGVEKDLISILGGKQQNLGDRRQLLGHYYSGNDIFVTGDKGDILNNKDRLSLIGIIVVANDELRDYINKRIE